MLVISTTHERMHRRFYWANCLGQLLDGPLPGVHLVFKQHPAEAATKAATGPSSRRIARRAGVPAPPVTVVRDIDLYSLLRAADAHLGLFSTVLTDAVAAGTPNLVATTQARRTCWDTCRRSRCARRRPTPSCVEALRRRADLRIAVARAAFLARHHIGASARIAAPRISAEDCPWRPRHSRRSSDA